jgi:tRNA (uracil-5-)-methyltransferase
MHYAIRRQQEPVLADYFPIANLRIQKSMAAFQTKINHEKEAFPSLRRNLTSISFTSSWTESGDSDCLVTLHYDVAIHDLAAWKAEAFQVCIDLNLAQITGRSRKRVTRALDNGDSIIRDTLWLIFAEDPMAWKVSLTKCPKRDDDESAIRTVKYEKPEEAFFHPNARAMCRALEWMMSRLVLIRCSLDRKAKLLEMYCGCGAHTIALLQTNLLEKIVAIELDERLVEACRRNFALNTIATDSAAACNEIATTLEIVSADAGVWARDSVAIVSSFDILLVDPPRQGLDEQVCRMAKHGNFQHVLYISCGRDALVRDLERLSDNFEVLDCTLLDLFPQTDAVESLVHLRRRENKT